MNLEWPSLSNRALVSYLHNEILDCRHFDFTSRGALSLTPAIKGQWWLSCQLVLPHPKYLSRDSQLSARPPLSSSHAGIPSANTQHQLATKLAQQVSTGLLAVREWLTAVDGQQADFQFPTQCFPSDSDSVRSSIELLPTLYKTLRREG